MSSALLWQVTAGSFYLASGAALLFWRRRIATFMLDVRRGSRYPGTRVANEIIISVVGLRFVLTGVILLVRARIAYAPHHNLEAAAVAQQSLSRTVSRPAPPAHRLAGVAEAYSGAQRAVTFHGQRRKPGCSFAASTCRPSDPRRPVEASREPPLSGRSDYPAARRSGHAHALQALL